MYNIRADHETHADEIQQFLQREFPANSAKSSVDRVDNVTQILVGSLQRRLGPVPKPESMVLVREVVRDAVETEAPVPVLVPFGPKKPGNGGGGVDLAELFVLKSLAELAAQVREHHAPGLDVRVRVEDATAFVLEGDVVRPQVERYVGAFEALNRVLGSHVDVVRETALMDFGAFSDDVREFGPLFERYLANTSGDEPLVAVAEGRALLDLGWRGAVSPQAREHYGRKYTQVYPYESHEFRRQMLARYFACALSRSRRRASGARAEWRRQIQVNFLAPVPGQADRPQALLCRRHVPLHDSKTHVMPWRAKGYFKISSTDAVCPAQVDWSEALSLDLTEGCVTFSDDRESVHVRADTLLTAR